MIFKVIIGSPYLKANQSIVQVVEVVTEVEKYNRFVSITGVSKRGMFLLS